MIKDCGMSSEGNEQGRMIEKVWVENCIWISLLGGDIWTETWTMRRSQPLKTVVWAFQTENSKIKGPQWLDVVTGTKEAGGTEQGEQGWGCGGRGRRGYRWGRRLEPDPEYFGFQPKPLEHLNRWDMGLLGREWTCRGIKSVGIKPVRGEITELGAKSVLESRFSVSSFCVLIILQIRKYPRDLNTGASGNFIIFPVFRKNIIIENFQVCVCVCACMLEKSRAVLKFLNHVNKHIRQQT